MFVLPSVRHHLPLKWEREEYLHSYSITLNVADINQHSDRTSKLIMQVFPRLDSFARGE